jgi:uncharacterized membrane protein
MSPKLKQKLELTLAGCSFSLGNIYMVQKGFPIFGIFLGLVAVVLLVRALLIRK